VARTLTTLSSVRKNCVSGAIKLVTKLMSVNQRTLLSVTSVALQVIHRLGVLKFGMFKPMVVGSRFVLLQSSSI